MVKAKGWFACAASDVLGHKTPHPMHASWALCRLQCCACMSQQNVKVFRVAHMEHVLPPEGDVGVFWQAPSWIKGGEEHCVKPPEHHVKALLELVAYLVEKLPYPCTVSAF